NPRAAIRTGPPNRRGNASPEGCAGQRAVLRVSGARPGRRDEASGRGWTVPDQASGGVMGRRDETFGREGGAGGQRSAAGAGGARATASRFSARSEEHTSELQ